MRTFLLFLLRLFAAAFGQDIGRVAGENKGACNYRHESKVFHNPGRRVIAIKRVARTLAEFLESVHVVFRLSILGFFDQFSLVLFRASVITLCV